MRDLYKLAPSVAFLHLAVDQPRCYLPLVHVPPSMTQHEPLTKVGRERIKVHIEAIAGEKGEAARGQHLSERVDEPMGHVLGARAELKHRQNLGEGIDGQPEPENLVGAAEPGAQFIQLQMREPEGAERALVQHLSVLTSARQPGGDGRLTVAEDAFSRGSVQPFGECSEHHGNLLGGGFQMVQRSIVSSAERGAASLTTERLDPLGLAMLAIANQCMNVCIGDAEVLALLIGTGIAFGIDPLGRSPAAFDLAPGTHRGRQRSNNRRVRARETTGRAVKRGAGLEQTVDQWTSPACL